MHCLLANPLSLALSGFCFSSLPLWLAAGYQQLLKHQAAGSKTGSNGKRLGAVSEAEPV